MVQSSKSNSATPMVDRSIMIRRWSSTSTETISRILKIADVRRFQKSYSLQTRIIYTLRYFRNFCSTLRRRTQISPGGPHRRYFVMAPTDPDSASNSHYFIIILFINSMFSELHSHCLLYVSLFYQSRHRLTARFSLPCTKG